MTTKTEIFNQSFLKKDLPEIQPGDTVRVHQKIKEVLKKIKSKKETKETKERVQVFEGMVIAKKHGKELGATITVRRTASGIGVEKIFPIHSPTIEKIEVIQQTKVRRKKLYYLRTAKGKKAKLKKRENYRSGAAKQTKETTKETEVETKTDAREKE